MLKIAGGGKTHSSYFSSALLSNYLKKESYLKLPVTSIATRKKMSGINVKFKKKYIIAKILSYAEIVEYLISIP